MTKFEQMLLDKGYIKHKLNTKTMKFEIANDHDISSMMNLDFRYFHKTDENVLNKIKSGLSVMSEDFTFDDRKGEICFGLHECDKPPTLVSPRPRIKVKRIINNEVVVENEHHDDSMNVVLNEIAPEEILKAMYDKSICFEIDLTKNN